MLKVVLVVVAVVEVFVGVIHTFFVVAVNLGHLSRLVAVPDVFENLLKDNFFDRSKIGMRTPHYNKDQIIFGIRVVWFGWEPAWW